MELIVVGVWMIWFNRNLWAHGNQGMNIETCCLRIKSMLLQFGSRSILGVKEIRNDVENDDCIEVYCDGACKDKEGGGFAAVVVKRNVIIKCSAFWDPNAKSAREMEWKALNEGQRLAGLCDVRKVNFLVDNANIVWEVQAGKWEDSSTVQFGQSFVNKVERRFAWGMKHIMRESNLLADALAKKARREKWCWPFPDAIPRVLSSAMEAWWKCI